jgi:hypothetical protein
MSYGYYIPESVAQARKRVENIVKNIEWERRTMDYDDRRSMVVDRIRRMEEELVYLHQWLKDNAN